MTGPSGWILHAAMAGAAGALSGACGKLSVSGDRTDIVAIVGRALGILLNVLATAVMWRFYLKALGGKSASTPVVQAAVNGFNFAAAAVLGFVFFGETVNAIWCVGAGFVIAGLVLLSAPAQPPAS